MKRKIYKGTTGHIEDVLIQNVTTGLGMTGLLHNSTGLVAKYKRKGAAGWTTIPLVAVTPGAWVSGGFGPAANAPAGHYELHLPDAALAAGVNSVAVSLDGVADMAPVGIEIELDAVNYQDGVRAGLTALPNGSVVEAVRIEMDTMSEGLATAALAAGIAAQGTQEIADRLGIPLLETFSADINGVGFTAIDAANSASNASAAAIAVNNKLGVPVGATFAADFALMSTQIQAAIDEASDAGANAAVAGNAATNAFNTAFAINTKIGVPATSVSADIAAIPNAVETQIIDETDAEKVLKAITDKIAAVNPDLSGLTLAAIAAAVRTEIERVGGTLVAVKTKTDNIPASPATAGELAAVRAKTDNLPAIPASQGDVTGLGVSITAIKTKTDNLPASPAAVGSAMALTAAAVDNIWDEAQSGHVTAGTFGARIDASISSVSTGGVSAGDIATAVWANGGRTLTGFAFTVNTNDALGIAAIKAKTDLIPAAPASQADVAGVGAFVAAVGGAVAALPTSAAIATAVNNTLSATHGAGSWEGGNSSGGFEFAGARAVILTIKLPNGNPALGAFVRVTQGPLTQIKQTSAEGVVVFGLDDGEYTLTVSKSGYHFDPETIAVEESATEFAATLTVLGMPVPSDPGAVTAFLFTEKGPGTAVFWRMLTPPPLSGVAYNRAVLTSLSDAEDLWAVPMLRGGHYEYSLDKKRWQEVTIPEDAGSPFPLPNIV